MLLEVQQELIRCEVGLVEQEGNSDPAQLSQEQAGASWEECKCGMRTPGTNSPVERRDIRESTGKHTYVGLMLAWLEEYTLMLGLG